mgnify:CR=1 FL=1
MKKKKMKLCLNKKEISNLSKITGGNNQIPAESTCYDGTEVVCCPYPDIITDTQHIDCCTDLCQNTQTCVELTEEPRYCYLG